MNACVTDFSDPEQMCHTAVMCWEITEYIVRHIRELNPAANDPCEVTQLDRTACQCPACPVGLLRPIAKQSQDLLCAFLIQNRLFDPKSSLYKDNSWNIYSEQDFKNRQPAYNLAFSTCLSFCPFSLQALLWKKKILGFSFKFPAFWGGVSHCQQGRSPASSSTVEVSHHRVPLLRHLNVHESPGWCWPEWGMWSLVARTVLASCVCITCKLHGDTPQPRLQDLEVSKLHRAQHSAALHLAQCWASRTFTPREGGQKVCSLCMGWPLLSLMHLKHSLSQIIPWV